MRLLTDEHIPPSLARGLRRPGIDAVALRDWIDGNFRSASDAELLSAAYADRRVLATFDCRTIPPLLKEWAEARLHHAGVILVDERTFSPGPAGGMLRALVTLVERSRDDDWEDRVIYLPASG